MDKEQFKKSISQMINYYVGQMIRYNLEANSTEDINFINMLQGQSHGLAIAFEQGLNELIEKAFGEGAQNESEVSGEE